MTSKMTLISKHNPQFQVVDFESVLSVGNGDFAFNCDITGFQTLYDEYLAHSNPLTTMSNWGWGEYNRSEYNLADSTASRLDVLENELVQDQYMRLDGRKLRIPVHEKPAMHWIDVETRQLQSKELLHSLHAQNRNKAIYNWLRQSPHRKNLGIVQLEVNGRIPVAAEIQNIYTELDLLSGTVRAKYRVDNYNFNVITSCATNRDTVHFEVVSDAFAEGNARLKFTTGKSSHIISGLDLDSNSKEVHTKYYNFNTKLFSFELDFTPGLPGGYIKSFTHSWSDFWGKVTVIELDDGTDEMRELERREILSLYNLAVHSSGSLPPQETGLMCNSWYGKFHLEMHLWHAAWAPLYNVPHLTERSLGWYLQHLDLAKYYAVRNGFKGCRWPKMVGPQGIESPSFIAPLLIWQQSHIIFLLSLIYADNLPPKFNDLVIATAEYMYDFMNLSADGKRDIIGPVIPAQEEFDPMLVKNPTFEMCYWKHCFKLVMKWFPDLNFEGVSIAEIVNSVRIPQPVDGHYPSHQNAPDTFPNYMKDHPMQLAILGLFDNQDVDTEALKNTLHRTLKQWDEQSMWGWDYGYMAMLAHTLDDTELAKQILLKTCPKNYWATNGHNYQLGRSDLPSYLPGNGALLWAIHKIWAHKVVK
jgi:hypothetical protein